MADDSDSNNSDTAARRKSRRGELDPAVAVGARTFTFVTQQDDSRARSHAMRESWRKRKQQKLQQQSRSRALPSNRRLVPKPAAEKKDVSRGPNVSDSGTVSTVADDNRAPELTPMQWSADDSVSHSSSSDSSHPDDRQQPLGVAAQALTGMNHALAAVSLDPFDTFPVKLTARHHELLHHCKQYQRQHSRQTYWTNDC